MSQERETESENGLADSSIKQGMRRTKVILRNPLHGKSTQRILAAATDCTLSHQLLRRIQPVPSVLDCAGPWVAHPFSDRAQHREPESLELKLMLAQGSD